MGSKMVTPLLKCTLQQPAKDHELVPAYPLGPIAALSQSHSCKPFANGSAHWKHRGVQTNPSNGLPIFCTDSLSLCSAELMWGASDASASDDGEAYVGGWNKDGVWWFHYQVKELEHAWAFKDHKPKKCWAHYFWLCSCARRVRPSRDQCNCLLLVTVRAMSMASWMHTLLRSCWWKSCFNLQSIAAFCCLPMWKGTLINGLMTSLCHSSFFRGFCPLSSTGCRQIVGWFSDLPVDTTSSWSSRRSSCNGDRGACRSRSRAEKA